MPKHSVAILHAIAVAVLQNLDQPKGHQVTAVNILFRIEGSCRGRLRCLIEMALGSIGVRGMGHIVEMLI
jgi:hypothetical protein